MRYVTTLLAMAVVFSGCGRVWVTPIQGGNIDANTEGVRFYAPHPYALVTSVKSSEGVRYKVDIIWLPDYSKEYIIRWENGTFGSIHPSFALTDGWNLASFAANINTGLSATLGFEASAEVPLTASTVWEEGLHKLEYVNGKWVIP